MTELQKKIIQLAHNEFEFHSWLFDHSVVRTRVGKVHVCGNFVIFVDNFGYPSVASLEEVKLYLAKLLHSNCEGYRK